MHQSRGNILFLILLAVVLFAALAYAVTSSMRGGGRDASQERLNLLATQILENASLIENTVMRAQMMDNIPDWGFDFYKGSGGGNTAPNTTCTQPVCRIYNGNGGNVPYLTLPAWAATHTGSYITPSFSVAQVVNIGTSAPELLFILQFMTLDLCNAMNRALNLSGIDMTTIDNIGGANSGYNSTMTAMPASTGVIGETNTTIAGKKAVCYKVDNTGLGLEFYRFHYVLLER